MNQKIIDATVELKADGYKSLYYQSTKGLEVIFRPLTFDEYETIMDLERYLDPAAINNTIVKMAVVFSTAGIQWVDNWKRAFDIDHIAQAILDISGFQNKARFFELMDEKRKLAKQVQSLMEIYICTAFKAISPLQLKDMTLEQQIELVAKAEEALGKPIPFDVIMKSDKNDYPVPEGMETTDPMLSADAANPIEWDKIIGRS